MIPLSEPPEHQQEMKILKQGTGATIRDNLDFGFIIYRTFACETLRAADFLERYCCSYLLAGFG